MLTRSVTVAPMGMIWTDLGHAHQHRPDQGAAAQLLQQFGGNVGAVQGRHDQHIRRAREADEGIDPLDLRIERRIRRHVAVIFEVRDPAVE